MSAKKPPRFSTASPEEIAEGKVSDIYFVRTKQILEKYGLHKTVRVEVMAKSLPRNWTWALFAGLEEVLELMEGHPVTIRAVPEGTPFKPYLPVLEIVGDYLEFGVFETAILGFLCQASGVATSAARCVKLAAGRPVISFGARRVHPTIVPMVERSAYIGGCAGVAAVKSAEALGITPTGTIPHALVILMGDSVRATKAFDKVIDPSVPRVALVDTFGDEKFESLAVAAALGEKLAGVRLDTTSSRRGDLSRILEEVRWELETRGHGKIKLFASGGINERAIVSLNKAADAYGIGTAISTAPSVDFSLDIVEVDGKPIAKRGKMSGPKDFFQCRKCLEEFIRPKGAPSAVCPQCGGKGVPLLKTFIENGKRVLPSPAPAAIREKVLGILDRLDVDPS